MKKRLILLVGCLTVAAHAQMGLLASGTQTVFRVAAPVAPAATQNVLFVEQPPFPTARTISVPSPAEPRPMLTLAQAFSNLTETAAPSVAPSPAIPGVPAVPSVVPPAPPTLQTTKPPEITAPTVQRTVSLTQAVSNLTPNLLPVPTQPATPVVPSVAPPTLQTVQATPPDVSVPEIQPTLKLSQSVSNLTQNALSSATQPAVPSVAQPMIPAAWAGTPVTQAVSVLNQAVSVLTQRVSAVNQTVLSLTQQTLPATQTDVSIAQPEMPAVPETPSLAQPVRPAVRSADLGTPSFQIANAGIRPSSPQFRQIEKIYYGVEESNIGELPVGMRFDECIHLDGTGLESTWTNGVFSYEETGRYTVRASALRFGDGIVTNMIAEQIRVPVVSTNVSQVGGATLVSEKTSLHSQGIWVGDVLKYPTTSVSTNNQVVISSLNGRTVKLARKEDIILEIAQPTSDLRARGLSMVPALESLPRATASRPRVNMPDLSVPAVPSAPPLPSAADAKTLSLAEAQVRGLDIRLREVTVIKWIWTTNNYNNLPRRTPVPHKMWVLGSEPVAEGFELF